MKGYIKVRASQVRRALVIYQEELSESREAYHKFKARMEATRCREFFIWPSNQWNAKYCDDFCGSLFVSKIKVLKDCQEAKLHLDQWTKNAVNSIENLIYANEEVLLDNTMMGVINRFGGLTND